MLTRGVETLVRRARTVLLSRGGSAISSHAHTSLSLSHCDVHACDFFTLHVPPCDGVHDESAPSCVLLGRSSASSAETRPTTALMPQKHRGEEGVKSKGRKKSDKATRNFELHGTYSAKHLRLIEASRERQAEARRTNT